MLICHCNSIILYHISFIKFCVFREEVEKFFIEMDRDFDGKLSFEEFMGEETHLERLFKSMDVNGDGNITKEVFKLHRIWSRNPFRKSSKYCPMINLVFFLVCSTI